jgi:DnaK suppressor protein
MTKSKLNEFRNTLTMRKSELEDGSRSRGVLAIETSPEELDRIQQAQDRDLAIGSLDRNAKLLREVRAALRRLDGGVYGVCRDCDGEIGMKRLAAVPWTPSCIDCQEAADRAGAAGAWNAAEELLVGAE